MVDWGFWAVALLLAAGVAFVLLSALRRVPAADAGATGLAIYKDQLAEIERDLVRGTIGAEEAARLRAEVGRRVLEADRARGEAAAGGGSAGLAAGLVVLALAGSLAGYWWLGAPGYPDLPIAERLARADALKASRPSQAEAVAGLPEIAPPEGVAPDFLALIEKLRATVAERPEDVQGLELLARNEAALGNFPAAEAAQRKLIAVKGGAVTAADHAALAEILIAAAGGYVAPEAEAELVAALTLDPAEPLARYYSGLMFVQVGRYDRGFQLWQALLAEGPPDAPWIAPIRAEIEEVAWRAGVRFALPEETGPDAAAVAAAGEMSAGDRQAMIEAMVAQLSDRLASEGGAVEDWDRLIRSLTVLQRLQEAQTIYDEAKLKFDGQAAELSFLRLAAVESGLTP